MLRNKKEKKNEKAVFSDILLVGQPNVGKSVLFSRITGVRTIASNYPGTTVDYAAGRMGIDGQQYNVIDAPGTYSLEPLDEAAKVTVNLLDASQRIINVVDATHLERHLTLTIELLAQNKPMVVALNMSDEARHKGVEINIEKLVRKLGIPVIATVARTGEGVKRLIHATLALAVASPGARQNQTGHPGHHLHIPHYNHEEVQHAHQYLAAEDVWSRVGDIVSEVQRLHHLF